MRHVSVKNYPNPAFLHSHVRGTTKGSSFHIMVPGRITVQTFFPTLSSSILSTFPLFTWIRPPAHGLMKKMKLRVVVASKIYLSILLQNAQTEDPAEQINCNFSSMSIHRVSKKHTSNTKLLLCSNHLLWNHGDTRDFPWKPHFINFVLNNFPTKRRALSRNLSCYEFWINCILLKRPRHSI